MERCPRWQSLNSSATTLGQYDCWIGIELRVFRLENTFRLSCHDARRRALLLLSTAAFSIAAFAAAPRAFGVQAAPVAASTSESSPFTYIGEFSKVRHTAEHSYGYTVQLWRQGPAVFGLFTAASGPDTDVPAGLLEDVSFNPSTGTISFAARLSVAATYLGKGRQKPTHDLFSFKGTLRGGVLAGLLTHVDKSHPRSPATTKRLRLPKTSSSPMLDSRSYDEWERSADAILKVRGSKW